jgi:hypothetical protein
MQTGKISPLFGSGTVSRRDLMAIGLRKEGLDGFLQVTSAELPALVVKPAGGL